MKLSFPVPLLAHPLSLSLSRLFPSAAAFLLSLLCPLSLRFSVFSLLLSLPCTVRSVLTSKFLSVHLSVPFPLRPSRRAPFPPPHHPISSPQICDASPREEQKSISRGERTGLQKRAWRDKKDAGWCAYGSPCIVRRKCNRCRVNTPRDRNLSGWAKQSHAKLIGIPRFLRIELLRLHGVVLFFLLIDVTGA